MSGTPITNLRTFYINSYYCNYKNTNLIYYTLDCEQSYIETVNKVSVTKIYIPNKVFQFGPEDFFTLVEGSNQIKINFQNRDYDSYVNMAQDLENILNTNSPNSFTYNIVINPDTNNTMTITVNDNTLQKNILITDKHLLLAYGLSNSNPFLNSLTTGMMTLSPIDMIFINSNCVGGYNTGNVSSSILTVFDLHEPNEIMQQTDLLTAAKPFNQLKNLFFALSDFDGELIELSANKHWWMELSLFKYDEEYIEKQKLYIDLITYHLLKKSQKEKENKEDENEKILSKIKI